MNQTKSLSLEELLKNYLDSILITKTTKVSELEVRFSGEREVFNGKYKKTIGQKYTKVDYDNVIQKLRSFKFKTDNPEGADLMRIYVENVRVEIKGIHAIQHYCINENMDKFIEVLLGKTNVRIDLTKEKTLPLLDLLPIPSRQWWVDLKFAHLDTNVCPLDLLAIASKSHIY
jgi:hypothetical protein